MTPADWGWPAAVAAAVAWQLGALLSRDREPRPIQPVAGAMAFTLALAFGLTAAGWTGPLAADFRVVMLAGGLVLLAGLWRDTGRAVPLLASLAIIVAAIVAVGAANIRFETVKLPFLTGPTAFLELGLWAPVISVVWITIIALTIRATDPLPGLTAGIGAIAAGTFLVVALLRADDPLAGLSDLTVPLAAVLLGACLGLLTPGLGSRALSLGHGGAGLLGFLLGVLTIVGTLKHTAFLLLALPALALAVPVLNLLYMQRQWRRAGRADPALLDRARSLPEMLTRRGFTHRRSTGLLLALQGYCSLIALALVGLIELPAPVKLLLLALLLPAAFGAFFLITRVAARVAAVGGGKVEILGVPIDAVTYDTALAVMDGFISRGGSHHVFTADVSGIMRTREDAELREIVRTCDLVTADGAGVLWAARLFDFPLPERVSGVDLVRRLCGLAARQGYRVYLLGAAPGIAQAAADILSRENPGLNLVGVRDGYWDDEAAVVDGIRAAAPDILFVALGIPRQEQFIRCWFSDLNIPLSLGIGGSFDVISGRLQRAPEWMQRAGLEWLFRVKQEPKRWRRLAALPRFVAAIAAESLRRWRRGEATESGQKPTSGS